MRSDKTATPMVIINGQASGHCKRARCTTVFTGEQNNCALFALGNILLELEECGETVALPHGARYQLSEDGTRLVYDGPWISASSLEKP